MWLWQSSEVAATIRTLAQEFAYAAGVALKSKKKRRRRGREGLALARVCARACELSVYKVYMTVQSMNDHSS